LLLLLICCCFTILTSCQFFVVFILSSVVQVLVIVVDGTTSTFWFMTGSSQIVSLISLLMSCPVLWQTLSSLPLDSGPRGRQALTIAWSPCGIIKCWWYCEYKHDLVHLSPCLPGKGCESKVLADCQHSYPGLL
jgi:hypothetical protein